jgi:hypothetical protein
MCISCYKKSKYTYQPKQRGTSLKYNFRYKYDGLTLEQFEKQEQLQGYKCAICKEQESRVRDGSAVRLAVDHCHETGILRGLLCADCNQMLGFAKDSPKILYQAIRYLNNSKDFREG